MNFKNISLRLVIMPVLLALSVPATAGGLFGFGGDDKEIWRASEQYVKLGRQDGRNTPPNDHPVELSPDDVAAALRSLEYWSGRGRESGESEVVFLPGVASSLGGRIVQGLAKAEPDQDVVFAVAQMKRLALGLRDRAYVGGRAFYKDGKLNIILGDYDRPPDRGRETAAAAHGYDYSATYFFNEGSRSRSGQFNHSVMTGGGIQVHEDDRGVRRNDWFVIDVDEAARTARMRDQQREEPETAQARKLREDAARMQREQRELRAEMARMRQEIRQIGDGSASPGSGQTIEERLAVLEKLRGEDLITDEEYQARRQEILSDI